MKIKVLKECGYEEALLGLGLSYGLTDDEVSIGGVLSDRLIRVSKNLCERDYGHNKFLESIQVWLDVTAPRYWHSEADTYRVGSTKQSQSTMHTIMKKPFTQEMFEQKIPDSVLMELEQLRKDNSFEELKNLLPEGFLQRRIWNVNYKVLRNILIQRHNHKLNLWKDFCLFIFRNVEHGEFFRDIILTQGSSGFTYAIGNGVFGDSGVTGGQKL